MVSAFPRLVSRFRNSPDLDIGPYANFGIEGHWQFIESWCRCFEVRFELDIAGVANFETATPDRELFSGIDFL